MVLWKKKKISEVIYKCRTNRELPVRTYFMEESLAFTHQGGSLTAAGSRISLDFGYV